MGLFGRSRRKIRIEILGDRSCGKTALMYRLAKYPVPEIMVPTAIPLLERPVLLDSGDQFILCEQKQETADAKAVVYLLDYEQLPKQLPTLRKLVATGENPTAPLLVVLNKCDLASESHLEWVAKELTPIIGISRSWAVMDCSAQNNMGTDKIEQWLRHTLKA